MSSGTNDCDQQGFLGIQDGGSDFKIDNKYKNMHLTTIGNFNMQFTMP